MVNIIHNLNVSTQSSYISVQYISINKHLVWTGVQRGIAAGSRRSLQVPHSVGVRDAHAKKLFDVFEVCQIRREVELEVENMTFGVKRTCLYWV